MFETTNQMAIFNSYLDITRGYLGMGQNWGPKRIPRDCWRPLRRPGRWKHVLNGENNWRLKIGDEAPFLSIFVGKMTTS